MRLAAHRYRLPARRLAAIAGLLIMLAPAAAAAHRANPLAKPKPWPLRSFQLGLLSPEGQAGWLRKQAPFGLRYAYLSGGVNTGSAWTRWARGNGSYVTDYITESQQAGMLPFLSYYEIRQSNPNQGDGTDQQADLSNLLNKGTMHAYYRNLIRFFTLAAAAHGPVVLQVEPDLWGYVQQASRSDNASTVRADVSNAGIPYLAGMPNTAAGLAQAITVLRDDLAPNVRLAYPVSIWGSGMDIHSSHPTAAQAGTMAASSYRFYRSLDAHYDLITTEVADRDAGYAQNVNGQGTAPWWGPVDYLRFQQYLTALHRSLKLPDVIWQIPEGDTIERVQNNTEYRYQDNHAQTWIGSSVAAHRNLLALRNAGVVALLFGGGQPTDTAVNATTRVHGREPAPFDGNTRRASNDQADGGYLIGQARRYYRSGPLRLHG